MSQPLTQKLVQIYMSTSIKYLSTRQLDTLRTFWNLATATTLRLKTQQKMNNC